jgi:oxygen-independent coproporphyrinogen-3 oxidase
VTLVGRREGHGAYVDALLAELELERELLDRSLETVFLGGGTPTFTRSAELEHLLRSLPPASEVTVEANPETVTPELAVLLREAGVTRVSLGAQSFDPRLLDVLERRAGPEDVRRAFYHLRDASFDNISLDLIYGIPGQTASGLRRDLAEAVALDPDHLSCYELEAKPGTRFTHAWGAELARQGEAMEGYFELVVEVLEDFGYRWYETANFCREGRQARHNMGYWLGRDYLGLGIGAVSTVSGVRWRNAPRLAPYLAALAAGERPPREVEMLDARTQVLERLMLGLRLDRPLWLDDVAEAIEPEALERLVSLGLVERSHDGRRSIRLTRRGRFLGGGVTAELAAETPAKELELTA